ncbi:ABC transporter permease subunit [Lentibacillus sediminis]|uniref:ABC transporter permease subunit n=1 Tax=Lentibacillus sediminis TaxID=1940529 RepID=UPI000C1BD3DD|nr:ABC transporter permease subunit [Lentibacillus sediminis]
MHLLKHELKMMIKSRKNLLFLLFLAALLFSYCFILLPNQETSESFHPEAVEQDLQQRTAQQQDREELGATGILLQTGQAVYATNASYIDLQTNMLTAFEAGNYERYLRLRTHFLIGHAGSFVPVETVDANSPFPGKDINHQYYQTLLRNQGYLELDAPVTYPMIEQKTGLQTLEYFFLSVVAYLIVFSAIYFSCDVLVRDRNNRSVLQGLPLSWYQLLNTKSLAAFLYTCLILVGLLAVALLSVSIMYGFGSFNMQVPVSLVQETFTLEDYGTISLGRFLLLAASFIPIIVFLFIRLNMIFSLVLKNTWVVLGAGTLVLFSELLYFNRRERELFGVDLSFFPQTYFDFGKVVTGEKNYLVNLNSITYEKGLIVLLVSIVVVELSLFAVSRFVNRRRFYGRSTGWKRFTSKREGKRIARAG